MHKNFQYDTSLIQHDMLINRPVWFAKLVCQDKYFIQFEETTANS